MEWVVGILGIGLVGALVYTIWQVGRLSEHSADQAKIVGETIAKALGQWQPETVIEKEVTPQDFFMPSMDLDPWMYNEPTGEMPTELQEAVNDHEQRYGSGPEG